MRRLKKKRTLKKETPPKVVPTEEEIAEWRGELEEIERQKLPGYGQSTMTEEERAAREEELWWAEQKAKEKEEKWQAKYLRDHPGVAAQYQKRQERLERTKEKQARAERDQEERNGPTPPEEPVLTEEAAKIKQDYDRKLAKFKKRHPDHPFYDPSRHSRPSRYKRPSKY